jgi:hypothetical protein
MLGSRQILIGCCLALAVAITARSSAKVIIVVQRGLDVWRDYNGSWSTDGDALACTCVREDSGAKRPGTRPRPGYIFEPRFFWYCFVGYLVCTKISKLFFENKV